MTFEERLAEARKLVLEFLNDLRPPRGLSDDALVKIIDGVADAFARKLPLSTKEAFADAVQKTFVTVSDNHKGYTWPSQAAFVDAMPKLSSSVGKAAAETFAPTDHLEAAAKKMRDGQDIGESYIWGTNSRRMINEGFVTNTIMDSYRMGSAFSFRAAYMEAGEKMMAAKYGDQVLPYYQKSLQHPVPRKRAGA